MANAAAVAAAFGGGLPPGVSGTNDRCTVLVSNLNPDVSNIFLFFVTFLLKLLLSWLSPSLIFLLFFFIYRE